MPKKKLIIWGATGQALVIGDIIKDTHETLAFFDNEKVDSPISNIPIYYKEDGFNDWRNINLGITEQVKFVVAIGGVKRGRVRLNIHDYLKGFLMPETIFHKNAIVAENAIIGEGAQILAGAVVGVNTVIGRSVIINTSAKVDHETILGDGVHIAPGATITGCVEVGNYSFIGAGSVVLPRIKIGTNSIIGAGSVVTKDIPDNVIAFGNPCRIIKHNE